MKNYLKLVEKVIYNGSVSDNRTADKTLRTFGERLEFDLSQGFPAVTTRKLITKGAFNELVWMLSGSVCVSELRELGTKFWDSWELEDGTIGSGGYGSQFSRMEFIAKVKPLIYEKPTYIKEGTASIFQYGYYGNADSTWEHWDLLVGTWRNLLTRLFYSKCPRYKDYGGAGVHIDPRWLNFENFYNDVQELPGWALKLEFPKEYSLDKDILYASNRYSKHTCMWSSEEEQQLNTSRNRLFKASDPHGNDKFFGSVGQFCKKYGLGTWTVNKLLKGGDTITRVNGWGDFEYLNMEDDGKVLRYRIVNQFKELQAMLKHTPNSRRLIISLYNRQAVDYTSLPPCHGNSIQFFVDKGRLDCQMTQRSGDLALGIPTNIMFYAALTQLLAMKTGLRVGKLIITIGDAHIYAQHIEGLTAQVKREPLPLCKLVINPAVLSPNHELAPDDFQLEGYQHHDAIPYRVSI